MKMLKNESFRKDILTKLAILLTAILLWSYVMNDTDPEITQEYRNVAVRYINESSLDRENLIVMNSNETRVDVKITGKRSDLKNFDASWINARLDLSGYTEGERKIPINVNLINQPSSMKVTGFEPREALLTIERLATKEVPIEMNYRGSMPEGYVIGNPTTKPHSVLVSGPRSWLGEIVKAQVTVDLTNKRRSTNISAPVRIINDRDEEVIGMNKDPGIIDIFFPVLRTKEVPIEIDLINNLPENYEISNIQIDPTQVIIKGSEDVLDIESIKTKKIDMNLFLNNGFTNVALDLPEDISLLNPNEEIKITYTVNEVTERVIDIPRSRIDLNNAKTGYIYNVDREGRITVTIKGHKDIVEALKPEDIVPFVDVAGVNAGTHGLRLQFEEVKNVTIKPIDTTTIDTRIDSQ